jgi:hypothetical protein
MGRQGSPDTLRWYEAEIHRLKGDILCIKGKSISEIEPHYEAAIAVAKSQGALAWELRAAKSLDALRKHYATTSAPRANATLNLS